MIGVEWVHAGTLPPHTMQWGSMQHRGVEQIACELARIGAVRFGTYTLKNGVVSPFYIDLDYNSRSPSATRSVITHKVYFRVTFS